MAGASLHARGKKRLDDQLTALIRWAEGRANGEPESDYPDYDDYQLNDLSAALETYYLLETFSDGMGGWNFTGVLGCPAVDLPETMAQDLLTLRRFAGIAERRKSASEKRNDGQ